jgi:hypothetical protein
MRLGSHLTAEQKARVSAANKGKLRSEETRARMSVAQKGHPVSAEWRANLSKAHLGHVPANKGIPMTDAQKAKVSAAHIGQIAWNKGIPATEEHKAKLRLARKGRIVSAETRAKMSVASMGHARLLGTHWSAETRAKHIGVQGVHWKGGRKVTMRKVHAKRRLLGFHPLNSPFLGCEGHHMDSQDVIHIPKSLHRSLYHNQYTGQGMAQMNALAGAFLTEDWT